MLERMQNPVDALELIVRLQSFALGENAAAMSDGEVAAAVALLDRVMPSQIEIMLAATEDRHISVRVTPG
jgi:hypothetical protein